MKAWLSLFSAVLLLAGTTQAVVVANFNFDDPSGTAKVTSDDTDPRSSVGNWITTGASSSTQGGVSGSTDMAFFRSSGLTGTFDEAVAASDFYSFTVTPEAGNSYSYTTLEFLFGGSSAAAAGSEFTAYTGLQASVGGGAFFTIGSAVERAVAASSASQLSAASFDLTGVSALQGTSAAVTFRFVIYSSAPTNNDRIVRMDNIVLNDNTIPEPSALMLCGLGAGLALIRRRRA